MHVCDKQREREKELAQKLFDIKNSSTQKLNDR